MTKVSVNKQNQAQVTIPKELMDALGWVSGDRLLFSKAPGQHYLIIEKISKGEKNNVK